MSANNKLQVTHDSGILMTFALFNDIDSCKEIRQTVMSGGLECSLLKTKMILDVFQVQVAAYKAVQLYSSQSMTTRNVHSEILYCLSPSKNITESFKCFGISDDDRSLFAVLVNDTDDEKFDKLCQIVGSGPIPLKQVGKLADTVSIKQAYKLTDKELSVFPLLDAIVSHIAAKDVIAAGKGKR